MKESFDIHRLGLLFARFWAEMRNTMRLMAGVSILALAGACYQSHSFYAMTQLHENNSVSYSSTQSPFPFFAIYLLATLLLTQVLAVITAKNQQHLFFQIPASKMEKFIFLLLAAVVLPVVALTGIAWLIDNMMEIWIFAHTHTIFDSFKEIDGDVIFAVLLFYFIVFAGYFVWKKNNLAISLTLFVVVIIASKQLNEFVLTNQLEEFVNTNTFGKTKFFIHFPFIQEPFCNGIIADFPLAATVTIALFFTLMVCYAGLRFYEKELKV